MADQYNLQELRWIEALIHHRIHDRAESLANPDLPENYRPLVQLDHDNHVDLLNRTRKNMEKLREKQKRGKPR